MTIQWVLSDHLWIIAILNAVLQCLFYFLGRFCALGGRATQEAVMSFFSCFLEDLLFSKCFRCILSKWFMLVAVLICAISPKQKTAAIHAFRNSDGAVLCFEGTYNP